MTTIMGQIFNLAVVQNFLVALLVKVKPQKVIAEKAGHSQSAVSKHIQRKLTGMKICTSKMSTGSRKLSIKVDGRTWQCCTRSGQGLESGHQEPLYTDMSRKWDTGVAFLKTLLNQRKYQKHLNGPVFLNLFQQQHNEEQMKISCYTDQNF